MSLEEVARATRIPLSSIEALEGGDVRRLPDRMYVVHFIRSYAQVIGLAPEEAILRFEEVAPLAEPAVPASGLRTSPPRAVRSPGASRSKARWVAAVLVLVLLALGAFVLHRLHV